MNSQRENKMLLIRKLFVRVCFATLVVVLFQASTQAKDRGAYFILITFGLLFLGLLLLDCFGVLVSSSEYPQRNDKLASLTRGQLFYLFFLWGGCLVMLVVTFFVDYALAARLFLYGVFGAGIVIIPYLAFKSKRSG